jgi:hypothetical protein
MSFYVKKSSNGPNWSLWETYFETQGSKRVRKQRKVPDLALRDLGVSKTLTLEAAKQRVSLLNREKSQEKLVMVRAARALETKERTKSVYVPTHLAEAFEQYLTDNYISLQNSNTKLLSHWGRTQALINELKLLPHQFFSNKQRIVAYLVNEEYSSDYAKKLIRILNLWGEFVSEQQGQFYRPIAKLKPLDTQRLTDSYTESESYVGESEPLTPALLAKLKGSLKESQWQWLYVALYFGLRPSEIDRRFAKKTHYKVEFNDAIKRQVVSFYQPKLVSLPAAKRWKSIPVILPEQAAALKFLEGELKCPLPKTLQSYTGVHLTKYCGRKGFVDLMLAAGQALENISAWMGHSSVDRTWRSYRNKRTVAFTKTG